MGKFGMHVDLHEDEWLPYAMRLPQGSSDRIRHRREGRRNLHITHEAGAYRAYCYSCGVGSRVPKEHSRLSEEAPKELPGGCSFPSDAEYMDDPRRHFSPLHWIAAKNLWLRILLHGGTEVLYSPSHYSLCFDFANGHRCMRSLRPGAGAKWLTLKDAGFLNFPDAPAGKSYRIVVEDPLSAQKLLYAAWSYPGEATPLDMPVEVLCALGTRCKDSLLLHLLQKQDSPVLFLFDGDSPGEVGAERAAARARRMGLQADWGTAPRGYDPKDLHIYELHALLRKAQQGGLNGQAYRTGAG